MRDLGLLEATPVELTEAPGAKPLLPPNWSELSAMTISYGHGLSSSPPLHLAAAYSSLLNGGTRVQPTLIRPTHYTPGERVVRPEVSAAARDMLRAVVARGGTASFGEVAGYAVGGKTGTADKPRPQGGYYDEKVIATFASVFPAHDQICADCHAGRTRRNLGHRTAPDGWLDRRSGGRRDHSPRCPPADGGAETGDCTSLPTGGVTLTSN